MGSVVRAPNIERQSGQIASLLAGMPDCASRLEALIDGLRVTVVLADDRPAVSRLRYRAYHAAGAVDSHDHAAIWEDCDSDENAHVFAVMLGEHPLASIRVHVAHKGQSTSPACSVFPELTAPWLRDGHSVIDSSCFCVEPGLAKAFPQLALVAVRVPVVLAQAFAPSWLIATPRRGHEGFYLRNFGGRRLAEPRAYPGRERPLSLVGNRIELITDRIFRRYPAYHACEAEKARMRALYGCPSYHGGLH